MADKDAGSSLYRADSPMRRVVRVAAGLSTVGALVSVAVVVWAVAYHARTPVVVLAALWAVLPPAWFWLDYFYVYHHGGEPGTFERFKHGQQVSAAIWAAIALTLTGLASGNIVEPHQCCRRLSG